ncbi:MAG: glycosyltransferase family 39 protein [Elusimicrobia bacterium]|nr:glycosyltransferase family 39 protein [Elusimicrobiota bacterium]
MPLIFELPKNLFMAAAFFCTSGAVGNILLRRLDQTDLTPLERLLFKIFLGFGLGLYVIWAIGLVGLFGHWTLIGLWIIAILSLRLHILEFLSGLRSAWFDFKKRLSDDSETRRHKTYLKILAAMGAVMLVEQLMAVHSPPIFRDDLSYQLYIPKAYLEMGKVQPTPFCQAQSFCPHMINMSYVPLMALGGELTAKIANFIWGIILALLGVCLTLRSGAPISAGLVAGIALYSTPILLQTSATALSDLPAACFTLGGLLAFTAYAQNRRGHYLWLSAAFGGFALNKYTSWSYPVVTALMFLWLEKKSLRGFLRTCLIFGALPLVIMAPFCLYLWILKGNPFYPLPVGFGLPFDAGAIFSAANGWRQAPISPWRR